MTTAPPADRPPPATATQQFNQKECAAPGGIVRRGFFAPPVAICRCRCHIGYKASAAAPADRLPQPRQPPADRKTPPPPPGPCRTAPDSAGTAGPAQPSRAAPSAHAKRKTISRGPGARRSRPNFTGAGRAQDRRICPAAPCRRDDGVSRPPEIERRKQNVSRSLIKHLHGSNRSNYYVFTAPYWVCNWLGTR